MSGLENQPSGARFPSRTAIFAWANLQKAEGRKDGIVEAARKAKFVVAGIKSAGQRAAALKVLRRWIGYYRKGTMPAKRLTRADFRTAPPMNGVKGGPSPPEKTIELSEIALRLEELALGTRPVGEIIPRV